MLRKAELMENWGCSSCEESTLTFIKCSLLEDSSMIIDHWALVIYDHAGPDGPILAD